MQAHQVVGIVKSICEKFEGHLHNTAMVLRHNSLLPEHLERSSDNGDAPTLKDKLRSYHHVVWTRMPRLLLLPLFAVLLAGIVLAIVLPVFLRLPGDSRLTGDRHIMMCSGPVPGSESGHPSTALLQEKAPSPDEASSEPLEGYYDDSTPPEASNYRPLNDLCEDKLYQNGPVLEIWTKITDFKPASMTLRVTHIQARGSLATATEDPNAVIGAQSPTVYLREQQTLHLVVSQVTKTYSDGGFLETFDTEVNTWTVEGLGAIVYPFDKYEASMALRAFISTAGQLDPKTNTSMSTLTPVTVLWYLDTDASQLAIHPAANADSIVAASSIPTRVDSHTLKGMVTSMRLPLMITRNVLTRCFSMVIVVIMWLLASFMVVAAIDSAVRSREGAGGVAICGIVLLLALPVLRMLQPGIPSLLGCVVDVCGFYWNMVMIAFAVLLSLARCVGERSKDKFDYLDNDLSYDP